MGLVKGRRRRGRLWSNWLWEGAAPCDENGALGLARPSHTSKPSQPYLAIGVSGLATLEILWCRCWLGLGSSEGKAAPWPPLVGLA